MAVRTFQRHPFLVKTLTSGVGFAAGDALAQLGTRKPGAKYDWQRTAKMAAAGWVAAGPLGYLFLVWMDKAILPQAAARWVVGFLQWAAWCCWAAQPFSVPTLTSPSGINPSLGPVEIFWPLLFLSCRRSKALAKAR